MAHFVVIQPVWQVLIFCCTRFVVALAFAQLLLMAALSMSIYLCGLFTLFAFTSLKSLALCRRLDSLNLCGVYLFHLFRFRPIFCGSSFTLLLSSFAAVVLAQHFKSLVFSQSATCAGGGGGDGFETYYIC